MASFGGPASNAPADPTYTPYQWTVQSAEKDNQGTYLGARTAPTDVIEVSPAPTKYVQGVNGV